MLFKGQGLAPSRKHALGFRASWSAKKLVLKVTLRSFKIYSLGVRKEIREYMLEGYIGSIFPKPDP